MTNNLDTNQSDNNDEINLVKKTQHEKKEIRAEKEKTINSLKDFLHNFTLYLDIQIFFTYIK